MRELQDDLVTCMNNPLQDHPPLHDSPSPDHIESHPPFQSPSPPPVMSHIPRKGGVDSPFTNDRDDDRVLLTDSIVESFVTPLEDAGVVLNPGKRKMDLSEFPFTSDDLAATDPTFTTPTLIKEKASFISEMDVNALKNNIPSSCINCNDKSKRVLEEGSVRIGDAAQPVFEETVRLSPCSPSLENREPDLIVKNVKENSDQVKPNLHIPVLDFPLHPRHPQEELGIPILASLDSPSWDMPSLPEEVEDLSAEFPTTLGLESQQV